jgi:hypothetical protein
MHMQTQTAKLAVVVLHQALSQNRMATSQAGAHAMRVLRIRQGRLATMGRPRTTTTATIIDPLHANACANADADAGKSALACRGRKIDVRCFMHLVPNQLHAYDAYAKEDADHAAKSASACRGSKMDAGVP